MNWDIIGNVSLDLVDIHVGDMFESSGESVVFADEWVKDISEVNVGTKSMYAYHMVCAASLRNGRTLGP